MLAELDSALDLKAPALKVNGVNNMRPIKANNKRCPWTPAQHIAPIAPPVYPRPMNIACHHALLSRRPRSRARKKSQSAERNSIMLLKIHTFLNVWIIEGITPPTLIALSTSAVPSVACKSVAIRSRLPTSFAQFEKNLLFMLA